MLTVYCNYPHVRNEETEAQIKSPFQGHTAAEPGHKSTLSNIEQYTHQHENPLLSPSPSSFSTYAEA